MKKHLSIFLIVLIGILYSNANISLASGANQLQLAEGMTLRDVEKSLGVTKTKKKKKKKKTSAGSKKVPVEKKNNNSKKVDIQKISMNNNTEDNVDNPIDVDDLLEELSGLPASNKNKETSNLKDNSDIVESIGIGSLRSMPYAEIIIINKITTKSQNVIFKAGDVKFFGNISVEIHKCINDPSILQPNNMMLMTIFDNKIDDDKLSIFHGWMMSKSLSASTLEHPVYDIIPVKCHATASGDSEVDNSSKESKEKK